MPNAEPCILIVEGNPSRRCDFQRSHGSETGSERYAGVVRALFPQTKIEFVNGADPDQSLPNGVSLSQFDGVIVGGSHLHAYDRTNPSVSRQIELVRTIIERGIPFLGSCWGLQLVVVALGGTVQPNSNGSEMGFARKITLTDAGKSHSMFSGKSIIFDSPCVHIDEVSQLPPESTLLASNKHSPIQAAVFNTKSSQLWAFQYHPEFNLKYLACLFKMNIEDMIRDGFYRDGADATQHIKTLEILHADPGRKDIAWQLGIDDDLLNPNHRYIEIRNWIESQVLPRVHT